MEANNILFLEHMNENSFDWLSFRNGSISSILKIPQRQPIICANKNIIRKFSLGYCKSDNLPCRPKRNQVAVMFNTDGVNDWWTHLRIEEFKFCFPEVEI